MKMKFLPLQYDTKEIEKSSKNMWQCKWQSEFDVSGSKWVTAFVNLMLVLHFASLAIKQLSMDQME